MILHSVNAEGALRPPPFAAYGSLCEIAGSDVECGAWEQGVAQVELAGDTRLLNRMSATRGLLDMFHPKLILGTVFAVDEQAPVVIISESYWRTTLQSG